MKKSTIIPNKFYQLPVYSEKKILIGLVLLGLLAGCQSSESCKKVLNTRCVQCHSASTSCAKVANSEKQWIETIDAMVKLGADVSKQERKTLAKCLSNPSGTDVEDICK
nr:hypothetical protein [uncultured Desulfobulbus sp.]